MAPLRLRFAKGMAIGGLTVGALAVAAPIALAYPAPPGTTGQVTATTCQGTIAPGASCSITAHFTVNGQPVANATVNWTVTVPPGGTISPNPSTTDGNGNTTVTYTAPTGGTAHTGSGVFLASIVHLAATTSCTGTITGTTGPATVTIPITTTCTTSSGGNVLPTAGTLPGGGGTPWALLGAAAVGMLIAVGGVARFRRARRPAV